MSADAPHMNPGDEGERHEPRGVRGADRSQDDLRDAGHRDRRARDRDDRTRAVCRGGERRIRRERRDEAREDERGRGRRSAARMGGAAE